MFVIQLDTLTLHPVFVHGFSNTLAQIVTTWHAQNAKTWPTAEEARAWAGKYMADRYTVEQQLPRG